MRAWSKPLLVVLSRGTSHESVLDICKSTRSGNIIAAVQTDIRCYKTSCQACQTTSAS